MLGIELTPEHPVDRIGRLAEHAEEVGFDTVFVSHHYNNRDEFVALADIARRTDSVSLGPGITNPYETHPVTLASRAATIDELSGGRCRRRCGPQRARRSPISATITTTRSAASSKPCR